MIKIKPLLPTLLLASNLTAITFDNGIKLDINQDENNNIHPDITLPIKYNDKLSSSLEYLTDKSIVENETVLNATISDKDTTIEHKLLRLNILNYNNSYENSGFHIGFGLQNETFYKTQTGYAQTSSININFNHTIDIKVNSVYLKSDFIYYTNTLDTKLNLNITPSSNLEVTQNTVLSDAVNSIGYGKSDESQKLSYELSFETMSRFNSYLNFGVEARYRFLPLKYDLKLANDDGSYSDKNYNVEEKISYIAAKIYFDTKLFNLMPTFGISSEDAKSTNKLDGKSSNKKEVKILFGLNGRF